MVQRERTDKNSFAQSKKKALSPVVATSLLLVVAVVAVVGFQQWYGGYSSQLFADAEIRSTNTNSISIEYISEDGILYVKIRDNLNLTIDNLKIGDIDCQLNETLDSGINSLDVSSCLNSSTGVTEIRLITDSGVISKSMYIDSTEVTNSSSESVSLSAEDCLFNDYKSGCEGFYEIKEIDGKEVVHDTVLGLYWERNYSFIDADNKTGWDTAKSHCEGLGDGNWRLPTLVEMETSLVDASNNSAELIGEDDDGSLFIDLKSDDGYWTNTRYDSAKAYFVRFTASSSYADDTFLRYVLCVREEDTKYDEVWDYTQDFVYQTGLGQFRDSSNFSVNDSICLENNTIYDSWSELCWQEDSSINNLNWTDAVDYCEGFSTQEDDWRLPEKSELITLLYHNGVSSTYANLINNGFAVEDSTYWTNTMGTSTRAYKVGFDNGGISSYPIDWDWFYALCVKTP